MQTLTLAKEIQDWSIAHRRHLHLYPELSLQEHQTSEYCQKILVQLGYKITILWETGFIADLKLGNAKTIAFRADMDALPIKEQTMNSFRSKNEGVAHMCGHDAHMAIALTTARILSENQKQLKANIRFVFQPSEEVLPGGARAMIEYGCLENVDEIYGLHNDPKTPVGTIRCLEGAMTASCDTFHLVFKGKGGHASSPHTALDPLYIAALMVVEMNTIVSRSISPMNPAVVSVTYFNAGKVQNIIPEEVVLGGVIRTFDLDDRNFIKTMIKDLVKSREIFGYKAELDFTESYSAIVNEVYGQTRIISSAKSILEQAKVIAKGDPESWGEDFAYYLQHRPGGFFILGSGNIAQKITEPLHSPRFELDEDALSIGAAIMVQLALDYC